MKKIIVPNSVRKQARKWMIERFIFLAIYLLIAYVFADYVLINIYEEANIGNLSFTLFFIYIIPFWASKIPAKLFDRDWYGEIVTFETNNHEFNLFDRKDRREKFTLTALVKEPNGWLHRHIIRNESLYKKGDKVIHIYGMKHLTPVRDLKRGIPAICVACGDKSKGDEKYCLTCGCSLEIELVDDAKKKAR